jgi:hypothetical protein
MSKGYDFAIFGASPLATLLAGLLAHDHGRQVLLIADPPSAERLPRQIDIALPFATRPQSWRLFREAEAETRAVLGTIDAAQHLVPRTVEIVADRAGTAIALAHMSEMARAFGVDARGGRFHRVTRLEGEISARDSRAQMVEPAAIGFDLTGDRPARLTVSGEAVEVGQLVLADDAAILANLPERQWPSLLAAQAMTATLTSPAKRLAAPVMRYPDRGVTLAQRADGSVLGLVDGADSVEIRLASCLPGPFPLQRRATTHFQRVITSDGAPAIGRLDPSQLFVIAGLGDAGAFTAPPLARLLAGASTDAEADWFAAHALTADRTAIADLSESVA